MTELLNLLTGKVPALKLRRASRSSPIAKWARLYERLDSFFDQGYIDLQRIKEICIRENIIENKPYDINYFRRHFRLTCERRGICLLPYIEDNRLYVPFHLRQRVYALIADEYAKKTTWAAILELIVAHKELHIPKDKAYRMLLWWRAQHNLRGKFFITKRIRRHRRKK